MPSTIKPRDDIDGCGCLDCQNIDSPTVRRTIPDTLVWSARLLRLSPSIVVAVFGVVLADLFLASGSTETLPAPIVHNLEILTAFVGVFVLRAYVGKSSWVN